MKQYLDKQLTAMLVEFDVEDTNFIIDIHNELLKGNPITKNKFYELVNFNIEKANAILNVLGEFNKNDEITAFSGLSLTPTNHKFIVGNKTLYTWCALDAILFADWLDVEAKVVSQDPIDNTAIELLVEGDHLISSNPYPLYISWVETLNNCNIRGSLCNYVSFWASEDTAKQWLKNNPDGKLLTLEDIFESNKIGLRCC